MSLQSLRHNVLGIRGLPLLSIILTLHFLHLQAISYQALCVTF